MWCVILGVVSKAIGHDRIFSHLTNRHSLALWLLWQVQGYYLPLMDSDQAAVHLAIMVVVGGDLLGCTTFPCLRSLPFLLELPRDAIARWAVAMVAIRNGCRNL